MYLGWGEDASLSDDAVLAKSRQAGEISAENGRVRQPESLKLQSQTGS